jgi:predicted aminopeptidase
MVHRSTLVFAMLVLATALSACSLDYLAQQGAGQLSLLMHREPVEHALRDPKLPARARRQLQLALDAKTFAEQRIGLRHSDSYTQLVRLDRDAVAYSVSASPRDRLEPYRWWFPIVGNVPYKGYFDRRDAEREAGQLEARGYDADVGAVPAYSLLGWFPDPLYSPMLADEPVALASTIIHELTHGTVFVAGHPSFNEGFAEFVGARGAIAFFRARFGESSPEVQHAEAYLRDEARFAEAMHTLATRLDALYESNATHDDKLRAREPLFERARREIPTLPFETEGFRHLDLARLNNAGVMMFVTYNGEESRFRAAYESVGGDLRRFVALFRERVARARDPEGELARMAAEIGGQRAL